MATAEAQGRESVFSTAGFSQTIEGAKEEIRELYRSDAIPWVLGYSGGKDSTAALQLVWHALAEMDATELGKSVHVISTDTLVENPVVAAWVNRSLECMEAAAKEQSLPIQPHRLTPELEDSFWVNLIGRGYPAPRNKFRWCTERLKIKPSNNFIRSVVRANGEAILTLGTRKAESTKRAGTMAKSAKKAVRERLTPNENLPNCLVYTPIEDWSNDDVWMYLMRAPNPWGYDNKELLGMYRGASEDGECPVVVDTSTPSCGNSRFGCWVCTLVDEDKSMGAMIRNDEEKEWMLPLLELRNELDFRSEEDRRLDRERRDFRRLSGRLHYYNDAGGESRLVPGPYKQNARAYWLRRVLETQRVVREIGPEFAQSLELITLKELQEIRRIWVTEKHEIEDLVPQIYEDTLGENYPGAPVEDNLVFDRETLQLLWQCCEENELHYEMVRNLLDIERRYRTMASRRGLFQALEAMIERCYYDSEEDALDHAKRRHGVKNTRFISEDGREIYVNVVEDPEAEAEEQEAVEEAPTQLPLHVLTASD